MTIALIIVLCALAVTAIGMLGFMIGHNRGWGEAGKFYADRIASLTKLADIGERLDKHRARRINQSVADTFAATGDEELAKLFATAGGGEFPTRRTIKVENFVRNKKAVADSMLIRLTANE